MTRALILLFVTSLSTAVAQDAPPADGATPLAEPAEDTDSNKSPPNDTEAEPEPEGEPAEGALEPAPPTVSPVNVSSVSTTSAAIIELEPTMIDVLSVEPIVDEEDRKKFAEISRKLERSIETARLATDAAKTRVKTRSQEVQVAKAELGARKQDISAAKKELKVQKLKGDATGIRHAEENIENAKVSTDNAKIGLQVKKLELSFAKAKLAHAGAVLDLETAKLAEAQGRAANPPIEQKDLLKMQKTRFKNESKEAKLRGKVSLAEAKLEKARQKMQ